MIKIPCKASENYAIIRFWLIPKGQFNWLSSFDCIWRRIIFAASTTTTNTTTTTTTTATTTTTTTAAAATTTTTTTFAKYYTTANFITVVQPPSLRLRPVDVHTHAQTYTHILSYQPCFVKILFHLASFLVILPILRRFLILVCLAFKYFPF